ncbi:MAG: BTAD domain-containing putative transcriptional regulator [Candidatus Krumholzibacteriia bacterium]
MSIPINAAKFSVPPLPAGYVPRPRLDALWDDWRDKRLVLATAGAGFGKTSFVAAGAAARRRPVLWLSCDASDRDPATFYAHLLALLPDPGRPAPAPEPGAPDLRRQVLASVLGGVRAHPAGVVLVLDDVHLLGGSEAVATFLPELIPYLPPGVTLVIASREELGLPVMKLGAMGAVAHLRSADLAYTPEEVADLFRHRFEGCEPDPDLCGRVVDKTEGWAAGIQILLQVGQGPDCSAMDTALARMTGPGSSWFRYFAEEVMERLEPGLADFLEKTAILPRLEPALCDGLLGTTGSRRRLETLADRNLFTFPVDPDLLSFRYHHLFRDFLAARLEDSLPAAGLQRLQSKAAGLLEKRGDWSDAALAYAQAGNPQRVLQLVEKVGAQLMDAGRNETIRQALAALDPRQIAASPGALSLLGRLAEVEGDWDTARASYRKALGKDPRPALRTELLGMLGQLELRLGNFTASRTMCRRALDGSKRLPGATRGRLLGMLGVAACELGHLEESVDYLAQSLAAYRRAGSNPTADRGFYLLPANINFRKGDFTGAKDAARQALVHFQAHRDTLNICHCLGVLALVAAEGGECREGGSLAQECLQLARRLSYKVMEGYAYLALARCALLEGDTERCDCNAERALRIGADLKETGLRAMPRITLAESALAAGNRVRARRLAQDSLELAGSLKDPYLKVRSLLLLGRMDAATRLPSARRRWQAASRIIERVGMALERHRLLIDRLAHDPDDVSSVESALDQLLAGAREKDHDFLFLTGDGQASASVLARALALGIEIPYASRLLIRKGPAALDALSPLVTAEDPDLAERAAALVAQIGGDHAHEILREATQAPGHPAVRQAMAALAASPAQPLAIRALGPFEIASGGRTLNLADWRSGRALRLLELLLGHRFAWVPRDVVMEALWPEADPRKAANSLRQTIFVLRRTLEPDPQADPESSHIRFHNEALKLEPGPGYSYDAESFEALLERARRCLRTGEEAAALPLLRDGLGLYRGAFFAERPYDEIVTVEREHLLQTFRWGLARLLDLLARDQAWDDCIIWCRRGLGEDRYCEDFHWHLVHAQYRLGNRAEALQDYQRYEELMIGDLDMVPAARLSELASKISSVGG